MVQPSIRNASFFCTKIRNLLAQDLHQTNIQVLLHLKWMVKIINMFTHVNVYLVSIFQLPTRLLSSFISFSLLIYKGYNRYLTSKVTSFS